MDLSYDLNEALAREGLSLDDINRLREELPAGTPKDITDKQLVLFLNACDNDLDYTRKVIKDNYAARKNAPEFFNDRDPTSPQVQQALSVVHYAILPVTKDGYHVIYYTLKDLRPSSVYFNSIIKSAFMLIDAFLNIQGPRKGLIILFDMQGISVKHTLRNSLKGMRKMFHYLQECLPCKLHKIHLLNVVNFFDLCLKITRPVTKPKLLELLKLHRGNVDVEEFFRDCIPKASVPSDYGGACPSIQELSADYEKDLVGMRDYFAWEERQRMEI